MEKQKQRKASDSAGTFDHKEKRPSMGFTNFLLILLILLFALNLGFGIWPYQCYETKVVLCDAVETYGTQGWRVVAAYSYS